ncbi:hypothetical protein K6M90_31100, partial [Rhizobium sp. 9T]|uniref:hypothetical protein n=1 Tax=Rhizobium TaxID=379 RepID=UPI001AECB9CF
MTAKVSFKGSKSLQIPQAPPPTFLFLPIFNCQKTDDPKPSPKPVPNFRPEHKPAIANPLEFLESERLRRQQRRRPRSVSGLIEPTPFPSQQ